MKLTLRDYQEFAVNSVYEYFEEHDGNPLIVMPTGTGKSLVIAGLIHSIWMQYPGQKIIVATHVKELIEQNHRKMIEYWPIAPAGIFSAGLKRRDIKPITFAGIASVADKAENFGHTDLVIIDEAHLLSPKEGTRYQVFLNSLRRINPKLKVIGLTATHYRLGQGLLTEPGGLFTDTCVDMATRESFTWFIDEGYLSMLIPKRTSFELDVSQVRTQQGDFNQRDLQETVDKESITRAALYEAAQTGAERHHWLVFASGIEHAEHIADMLSREMNIPATFVHSKMDDKTRDRNIKDFKLGKYRAMVNNGILTTGFDYPEIDMIVMLRPTKSTSLWVQMLGRGTRPVYFGDFDLSTRDGRLGAIACGPKHDCLVLDFARNTPRLGPVNDPVLPRSRGKSKGGEAPVKVCAACGTYNHASVRFCVSCQAEFARSVQLTEQTSMEELVTRKETITFQDFEVAHVTYANYETKAKQIPALKTQYFCGMRMFTVYHCFQHMGLARKKAREWWRNSAGTAPPDTVDEAMLRLKELRTPKTVQVWMKKEHPEVTNYEYP